MGLSDIKKELNKLDKDKLIYLIADLYKKNKTVKEFFDFYVNPNEEALFTKYRNKVKEAFYPKHGFDYSLKDGKKAISEFKKLEPSNEWLADLMLFYVETGVQFTNDYGDINEAFYASLESTYLATLKLMQKEGLMEKFADRIAQVVKDTENIGWGFHHYLYSVYWDFYESTDS